LNIEHLAKLLGIDNLPLYLTEVEKNLRSTLEVSDSKHLKGPALRLIEGGGKRVRPFLVIAAALSQDGKFSQNIVKACTAIELVHIGTIVHDDIIDNADIRWGVKTINSQEGVDRAVLVGDYLLALAMLEASSAGSDIGWVIASTIAKMCEGQSLETADEFNLSRTQSAYSAAINKKTASLTSAACEVGALCAKLPRSQSLELTKYGEAFGMSFQLADDLLDFLSSSEVMGKPVGNDIKEGVYTYPLLVALQGPHRKKLEPLIKEPDNKSNHDQIVKILLECGALGQTLEEIKKYNEVAVNYLKNMDTKTASGLSKLPGVYLDWAMKKQSLLHL
jgi:geranylgeranyl pyrophosphate synthase